jgi:hypothetical protein
MAFETELANIAHQTDILSTGITPALVKTPRMAKLIRYESLPVGITPAKLLRKAGYVGAEEVSESAVQAIDGADNEYTETSVTLTARMLAATLFITDRAMTFSDMTVQKCLDLVGGALGRDWEEEVLAKIASFSNSVTSASVMTLADAQEAAYLVRSNTNGVSIGQLKSVLSFKQIHQIQKELSQSAAASLSVPSEIVLLSGAHNVDGYVGSKGGVDFYEQAGLPTNGGDTIGCVFDPMLAFGAFASDTPKVAVTYLHGPGDGTRSFGNTVSGLIYVDVEIWNQEGGVKVASDT